MDKKLANDHVTIQEIFEDESIRPSYKTEAIAYSVLIKKNIKLDELEMYLRDYNEQKDTDYNKLLVIYDYLKYGKQ